MNSSQSLKIVIVTESILGQWFDGVALLVRHFLEHLPPEVSCKTFSLEPYSNTLVDDILWPTTYLQRIAEVRGAWLLRVLGIPLGEKKITQTNIELFEACDSAEAIFVFTSAGSAFASVILSRWPDKTIMHLTDCASVYAARSGMWKHFIRQRLSEWKVARARPSAIVFVSPHDRDMFERSTRSVAPRVSAIPLGVDSQVFQPHPPDDTLPDRPFTLLFTGVLDYTPNTEAAEFIVSSILPKLPADSRIIIAGMNPPPSILESARMDSRLSVTGSIPNIEQVYRAADLFIAPMFKGAGMQNKILQALSSGLPVLTTSICVAAFEEESEALVVCSGVDEFLNAIHELKSDPKKRHDLSSCARNLILRNYSWERRCHSLLDLIKPNPSSSHLRSPSQSPDTN